LTPNGRGVFASYARKRVTPLFRPRRFSGPSFVPSRKRAAFATIADHIDILVSILEAFRFASELVSPYSRTPPTTGSREGEKEKGRGREREREREREGGRETPAQNGAER